MSTVLTKTYNADNISVNENEILRYAGIKEKSEQLSEMLDQCLFETENIFSCKVCYLEQEICIEKETVDLKFAKTASKNLSKNLYGCNKVIIFAATVGYEIDRLINKYSSLSPIKALVIQAIGNERIEAVCDLFCKEISEEYKKSGYNTHVRFSPGYGDLDLGIQKHIFSVLDCPKKIGLTLNDSLMMSPSKSVTAIIGLSPIE